MWPAFQLTETELLAFALVLIRVSAFVVAWPVFSVYQVPQPAKVLLGLIIAMVLYPSIARQGLDGARLGDEIAWLAGREAFIGACMGFVTRLFFFAMSMGANLIATYMGLSSAQVFDPTLNMQSTVVEQFHVALATLVFLALNGHHFFIEGLAKSFQLVPLTMNGASVTAFGTAAGFINAATLAAVQVSAPVMVVIFIVNVFMGVLGRAVPQINVLVTSFTVNVAAGTMVMIMTVPALLPESESMMRTMAGELFRLLKAF